MKISFHGAAGCVTGSKHLITANGKNILLDCGMFQGHGKETDGLNRNLGFDPKDINYMILSHAHIDHSGLIPRLVKEGFTGKIFATPATIDLANILLRNSAYIQEADIRFINKRRKKENKPLLTPIYVLEDAIKALPHFVPVEIGQKVRIDDNIELSLYEAGHIIGATSVFLEIEEDSKKTRLVFSGDVGRYGDPILKSPEVFPQADHIIIESTYGNKNHDSVDTYAEDLKREITRTCIEKKGKLIIPAFSVGRTQEILFALNELELDGELPAVDYFVDSPLSTEATQIVKKHPECYNKAVRKLMKIDYDVFDFVGLKYIENVEASKALNSHPRPCVIISASGMAEAGRVKHHIANSVEDPKNTILMVGYCEPASLGARLKRKPEEIGIFGTKFKLYAEVKEINSMSAHADYNDLCQYLACQNPEEIEKLFIVHGEPEVQEEFKIRLIKKGFRDVVIPKLHESFSL